MRSAKASVWLPARHFPFLSSSHLSPGIPICPPRRRSTGWRSISLLAEALPSFQASSVNASSHGPCKHCLDRRFGASFRFRSPEIWSPSMSELKPGHGPQDPIVVADATGKRNTDPSCLMSEGAPLGGSSGRRHWLSLPSSAGRCVWAGWHSSWLWGP